MLVRSTSIRVYVRIYILYKLLKLNYFKISIFIYFLSPRDSVDDSYRFLCFIFSTPFLL